MSTREQRGDSQVCGVSSRLTDDIGNIDVGEVLWSPHSVSTTHHCDHKDFLLGAVYTKLISLCFPVRGGLTY